MLLQEIEWVTVESSCLDAVFYDQDEEILYVRFPFRAKALYSLGKYYEVPHDEYEELMRAESKGKYFCAHIRNDYDFEPIYDEGDE